MAAVLEYNSVPLSRRAIAFSAIIAVHVLLIWAFSSGLAIRVINVIAPPLQTDIIDEMQKRDEPLPPPAPKLERPPVEIPPPEVDINLPAETSDNRSHEFADNGWSYEPYPYPRWWGVAVSGKL